MLALLRTTIILLFLNSFTFICFSMDIEDNLFKIVRNNSTDYSKILIDSAPIKVQKEVTAIKLRKKGIINHASLFFLTGQSLVGQIELAKAIARHHNIDAWIIDCPMLSLGSTDYVLKKIRKIFNLFKSLNKPQVLIFDEINQLMNKTNKLKRLAISSCFCNFMDNNHNNPNLILIGTANELTQLPKNFKFRITSSVYPVPLSYETSTITKLLQKKLKQYNGLSADELSFWAKTISKKQLPKYQIKWLINSSIEDAQIRKLKKHKADDSEESLQKLKELENTLSVSSDDIKINFEDLCKKRLHFNIDKPFHVRLWNRLEQLARSAIYQNLILPLLQITVPTFPIFYYLILKAKLLRRS